MTRKPPAEVRRKLRQEVNYGCPIPGCGCPFLTWHHFDPPWREKKHHNPKGMIALCDKHHRQAEVDVITVDEIKQYKTNPNSLQTVQENFPWAKWNSLFRLGGCYAAGKFNMSIDGVSVLSISQDETGTPTFSFRLEDAQGNLLAEMNENTFIAYPDRVHDLVVSVSGHQIKVWSADRRVGFEAAYSFIDHGKLENFIEQDHSKAPRNFLVPDPIEDLDAFYAELKAIPPNEMSVAIPKIAAIGFRRKDAGGTFLRWLAAHLSDDQGRIPFINLISSRLFHDGRCFDLKNGKTKAGPFNLGLCVGNELVLDKNQCVFR